MAESAAAPYGNWFTPYRAVLRSRMRSQQAYPLSFAADMLSSLLVGVVEFAEVWVIYHNVRVLGGLDMHAMLLLFGLSNVTFAIAQIAVGHTDTLPTYIRLGTLDAFHLRPQPLLLQLITSDISLRRLTRAAVAAAVLAAGLVENNIHWTTTKFALLALSLPAGVAIFAGLFVAAAGLQFFLIDGSELTNSFTYGGAFAAQQPTAVFGLPLQVLFGFAVPVAFVAYLPTIALLGHGGPDWLPAGLAWATPGAALWIWALALTFWQLGVRHYQGGGG
ncbi:ABC transporter permease [Nocardia sp. alder85J]|uniref:ABC transporter permease n=1 Tax=Nocardia sp. alder85J TaxID=2862949 RepID=UPI001CD3F44B|nr:ABC-2 family transporter protein [Nocardia sp. alder85J]MCX4098139.1 ABC-2 family transporter protein [Nocardia sp. alder85J]